MFNITTIRGSVCELAAKTKEKKRLRAAALARWRADRTDAASFAEFETQHAKSRERGSCARYWLLVYAFARGRNYRRVERWTNPGNVPSVWTLAELLEESLLDRPPEFARVARLSELRKSVETWLAEPSPTIAVASAESAQPLHSPAG